MRRQKIYQKSVFSEFFLIGLGLLLVLSFTEVSQASVQGGKPKNVAKTYEYMPGRLVIKLKDTVPGFDLKPNDGKYQVTTSGAASLDQLNAGYSVYNIWNIFPGEKPVPKGSRLQDLTGYYEIQFPEVFNLDSVLAVYQKDPNLELAEKVPIYYIDSSIPNDLVYYRQWYLGNVRDNDMDMFEAWDYERGDSTVVLGIVDTGILYKHPDLGGPDTALFSTDGNIWVNWAEYNGTPGVDDDSNGYTDDVIGWDWVHASKGWQGEDFQNADNDPKDFNGHGTHVAGISAAMTNNAYGATGIAGGWYPDERGCMLMALRAGWSDTVKPGNYEGGVLSSSFIASAINYARQKGATAVNNSWGGGAYSSTLAAAIHNALEAGVVIVKSAGNDGSETPPDFVSDTPRVVIVAATDSLDKVAGYSNYGTWVDVCAPGSYIYSTYSSHYTLGFAYLFGTSMSAPMVTGLAGLFKSKIPSATGTDLANWIINYADSIDAKNPFYAGKIGSGRVNANNFLSVLPNANFSASPTFGKIPLNVSFTNTSTGTIDSVKWDFGDSQTDTVYNPNHTYNFGGVYSPSLTAYGFSQVLTNTQESLIVAVADSVEIGKGLGGVGQNTVPVSIYVKNLFPSSELQIPLRFGDGTKPVLADSVKFLGRANSFLIRMTTINPDSQTVLIYLNNDPPVAAGSGVLAKIFFHITDSATAGDTIFIEVQTIPPDDSLLFTTGVGSFEPFYVSGCIVVEAFRAGDVNLDNKINLGDIIYLVNYIFKGGPAPNPIWLGDVNVDNITNLGDLIFLVNYIFKGGPGP